MVQQHGERDVWLNPPPLPLSTAEMDYVYDLPYARNPHPAYAGARFPAWDMIRFSVNIMRGCFGGCTFCSITEHEGRIIQSRSEDSVIHEIEEIRDKVKGFTGVISDLGGPTANMYRIGCRSKEIEAACRKPSCVYPGICPNLNTHHGPLIKMYRRARELRGVKKIVIPDVRRPNEAAFLRDAFESAVTIIKIVNPRLRDNDSHPSETEVDDVVPNITIYNERAVHDLKQAVLAITEE